MKRIHTVLAALAFVLAAPVGVANADTPADFGKAIHCGFLEGAGSSFLDSSCNDAPKYQPNSWDAGTYYGRSNCEQAGRNAIASGGRANHYRCYRNDGEKFTLTLSV